MKRSLLSKPLIVLAAALLMVPVSLEAATSTDTVVGTSTPANVYEAGGNVSISSPSSADLLALGSSVAVTAPVAGDALVGGGRVTLSSSVGRDVRALGGEVSITGPVGGDITVAGGSVMVAVKAREIDIAGGKVEVTAGADGPVTIYANSVTLSGTFTGNVRVIASDKVVLADNTVIRGEFQYNAPSEAVIPASVKILGGSHYIGSSTFLPSAEEARTFALAGVGIFFLVRLIASILAASLMAGLFPVFGRRFIDRIVDKPVGRVTQIFLVGLGTLVGVPIVLVLLLASFVGIGIAALLAAAYILALLLSYLYAGILIGALIARAIRNTPRVSWKTAFLGMLVLYLLGLIPTLGFVITFVLSSVALGAIVQVVHEFAFPWNSSKES